MAIQIQLRRGTAAEWTTANPILAQGEFGYESDTTKFKVGSGTASWSALSYASGGFDAAAASPIFLTRASASALYVADATFTAKGDILAGLGSGTFNNLPVGPNTYVLTADTSASAGIKWAAAAEAGFNAFLLMGA